jgi:predicted 3-demethylubiquinone-9 3-methyltransferase (glyoxalase superfamily)
MPASRARVSRRLPMQRITTFLWFDDNAEEAIELYVSLFKDSKIISESRYPEGAPGPSGGLMTATFQLEGQRFMALNGGPVFSFTPAVSLFVDCRTQGEVDELWERLSEGGSKGQCGWLTDRFGLSWQIVPEALGRLMGDPDPAKSGRVMQAMLKMGKLDIAALERAYAGD